MPRLDIRPHRSVEEMYVLPCTSPLAVRERRGCVHIHDVYPMTSERWPVRHTMHVEPCSVHLCFRAAVVGTNIGFRVAVHMMVCLCYTDILSNLCAV